MSELDYDYDYERYGLTVITPSLPERHDYRLDCIESVAAQTSPVAAHTIAIDYARRGVVPMLNQLLHGVQTPWLLVLADDDLLDDDYVQSVRGLMQWGTSYDGRLDTAKYEVYYSYCRVVGRPGFNPNQPFDADRLKTGNYIPATAIISTDLARRLGGWRDHQVGPGFEDWDFWLRAVAAGARFRCLQQIKWTYRFHGKNLSHRSMVEAA